MKSTGEATRVACYLPHADKDGRLQFLQSGGIREGKRWGRWPRLPDTTSISTDHTEFRVLHSFIIWLSEKFVSHNPTPAVRPSEWTLSAIGEPCLSPSALRRAQGSGQAPRVGSPSRILRPSHFIRPDGASMVLATFAETKSLP